MIKLIIPVVVSLFLTTVGHAQGGAKKVSSSVRQQKNLKDARVNKKKFNFTYEKKWFAGLNKKQQDAYLRVVSDLVLKLSSKKRYSSNDTLQEWLDLFLTPAYAINEKINNGFIYQGNWQSFISGVNMGPLAPTCPAGQTACAPYTGLTRDSAGTVRLTCSDNSTPSCVQNGNRTLLRETIEGCRNTVSDLCNTLTRLMTDSTRGVSDYCQSRSSTSWCSSAMSALRDAGVQTPPAESSGPTGANCDAVANEAVRRKEASRTTAAAGADAPHYSNNTFWRNMTSLSRNICGRSSLTATSEIVGVCNVTDMNGPDGALVKEGQSVTYRSNDSDTTGFQSCIQEKLADLEKRTEEQITRLNEQIKNLRRNRPNNYRVEIQRIEVQIADAQTNKTRSETALKAQNECSRSETVSSTAPGQEMPLSQLSDAIIAKVRSSTDLTPLEENQFKAATGLSARQFRDSFCASTTYNFFKNNLSRALQYPQPVRADMRVASHQQLAQQAEAALFRMNRCLAALRTTGETGCSFYDVEDFNVLRTATADAPIIAKNKQTGECVLVTHHEFATVNQGFDSVTGDPMDQKVSRLTIDNLTTGRTITESPNAFARANFLKAYRCNNDTIQAETYVDPNPESTNGQPVNSEI